MMVNKILVRESTISSEFKVCPDCGGRGSIREEIPIRHLLSSTSHPWRDKFCNTCGGRGTVELVIVHKIYKQIAKD